MEIQFHFHHRRRNRGAQGHVPRTFSQIISQSAPLQLKKLPGFVYEGAPECMYPHFLNVSYVPDFDSFCFAMADSAGAKLEAIEV